MKINNLEYQNFIDISSNGTIFHSPYFLAYHKKKFQKNSYCLISRNKSNKIIAGIIFTIDNNKGIKTANSHYGASFGGFVHLNKISYFQVQETVIKFIDFLKKNNVNVIKITVPPSIYHKERSDIFEHFYLKYKSVITNADLTSYVSTVKDPFDIYNVASRNAVRKALKNKLKFKISNNYKIFYEILANNLKRFNVNPTHSLEEILWLVENFKKKINLFVIEKKNKTIAGSLVFECSSKVLMVFYWAHLSEFQIYRPINFLLYNIAIWGYTKKFKYLDLGLQTTNMKPNIGGIKLKESFGSKAVLRTSYKIKI